MLQSSPWKRLARAPFVKALLLLLFVAPLPSAHADFGVGPMEAALTVPRSGAKVTSQFELFNSSDQPVHISAYAVDWDTDKNGSIELKDAGTTDKSCAKWIQINPAQFILQPQKAVKVRYSVETPADFNDERRAMVFFQSRPVPTEGKTLMQVAISTRIGCKLFVLPPTPLTKSAAIAPLQLDEKPLPETSNIVVSFHNTGMESVRLSGTVEAVGSDGKVQGSGKLSPSNVQVLPGKEQELRPAWDKPLPPGSYHFRAVVDYGDKKLLGVQGDFSPTQVLGLVVPQTPTPAAPPEELPDATQDPDVRPGTAPDAPLPVASPAPASIPQGIPHGGQK